MQEKCIIWGMGEDYEKKLNQIYFEIYKGNITVEAIVCRKEDKYCEFRDGFKIIIKEELNMVEFDYLIVTSSKFYSEIRKEAINLGIEPSKIINGRVFLLPLFDFALYSRLIKNPVTILSDDCWGGYVYNRLGLEFSTPLINIYWEKDEYAKFIQKPLFYLQTELTMVREGDLKSGVFPIGRIGNETDFVQMSLVHNIDFEEAKKQWDRRKKRINPDNIVVKMGFASSEENVGLYLDAFKKCKYKKVLFYNGDENIEHAVRTNRFIWKETTSKRVTYFDYNDYLRSEYPYVIDVLKLLNGIEGYLRE